jgi:DNA topoisomerase I
MGKSLVIVESPAKAKTINKYLGSEFIVKSSVGHIRDLPKGARTVDPLARSRAAAITRSMSAEEKITHKIKKAREKLFISMGVNPEKDWQAQYEILPGKEKVVAELKKLAKNADTIYLATDLDREGEAIAWHLKEIIGGNEDRYKRVVFNEITKKAIQEAFSKPTELDMDRVNAQQARRFLDRVVGYMVSPLLWRKVARSLSAGRVQSVAVKLVVEREREIKAFDPDEYWTLHADLESESGEKIRFEIKNFSGENFLPKNKEQTYLALETLNAASYSIIKREDKPTGSKPSAPFITSTLQQAASTRLGYGVKKTMVMAQRLYQAGYITYMRTDSANLSVDAVAACRNYIEQHFGKKYLPKKPNIYSSKSDAQEAHEAIRPSNVDITPDDLIDMDDARQLYQLIWQQFLACQMMPAEFTSTTVKVEAAGYELKAKGRVMRFDGYLKALPLLRKKDDDDELPDLCVGDIMKLNVLLPLQHFTKSPPRFSEAALVKELEKLGIGRPSTYAAIISKIQDAGYVRVDNRRFYAEKIGDIVTVRLNESFSDLMNYGFTAAMEVHLDDVASGKRNWKDVLNRFYVNFSASLSRAESEEGGMRLNEPTLTDLECPRQDCLRLMTIRTGATGVFLSCAGYTLPPKEQCKSTLNLSSGDEAVNVDDDEAESRQLIHKHRCGICDTAMDSYLVDTTRKLHICGKNPSCPGFEVEKGAFVLKGYEGPSLSCDKCGMDMHLKDGRFGKYFDCTAKDCKNTRKLLRSGEAAPPKMDPVSMPDLLCVKVEDHYILRDGAVGMFLAASQYPKYRETRAPLVVELIPYKDAINSKYEYLFSAPQKDSDGLQALVRFDRKNKEHYVQTELGGKPTGWRARYTDGHWKIEDDRKTAKK